MSQVNMSITTLPTELLINLRPSGPHRLVRSETDLQNTLYWVPSGFCKSELQVYLCACDEQRSPSIGRDSHS